jgi:truncated hemoglobin YjbI
VLSVPSLEGRRAFLTDYLARLEAATLPEEPAGHGLYRMSHELREIWITLLPTAAAFLGTDLDARRTTEALSESRRWALHTLARALASVA